MRLKGWPIVLAVTFACVAWALGLRWLTPRQEDHLSVDEEAVRRRAAQQVIDRLPVDVLERWAQELGLPVRRLDAFGILPWDGAAVVAVQGEPPEAAAFWDLALTEVARTGARLVWLPTSPGAHGFPALGISFEKATEEAVTVRPAHPIRMMAGIDRVELTGAGRLAGLGTPVLRLLEDEDHGVYAVLVQVGRGEVVIVNAPGLAGLEGLRLGDNALFLAALLRRDGAPVPTVAFIRARETARELLLASIAKELEGHRREARRLRLENPLLTLWSLVAANPSCLVLVQLLLAALVHLLGSGRDLEAPAVPPAPSSDRRVLAGLASLYRAVPWGARVLLPVAHGSFRLRLRKALGAAPGAEAAELEGLLSKRSPDLAARFVGISIEVQAELTGGLVGRDAFARLVRRMDDLLREVER